MSGDGVDFFDDAEATAIEAELWAAPETFNADTMPAADTEVL